MWIFVLEAMVALGMLLLIVWLTLGSARRRDAPPEDSKKADEKPPDRM